ncbi:YibE/F family protein [Ethanoligenens sp.]|uniref:YibE/F family protein n=1 Tax=Ethanoligenens sp. TaxID=2099655 RepID=UPI0039E7516D
MQIKSGMPKWVKISGKIVIPVAILAIYIVFAVLFSQHTATYNPYGSGAGGQVYFENATVQSVDQQSISQTTFPGLYTGRQLITVLVNSGQYKGHTFQVNNALNYDTNIVVHKGQSILVSINTSTSDKSVINVYMYAPNRFIPLLVLIGLFVAALCFVGGWRGFRSLLGIFFTLTTMLFVFVPLLLRGVPTFAATLVLVAVTSCVTLFLVGGLSRKSLSAVLGTVAGVVISILILLIFSNIMGISGYTSSDTDALLNIAGQSRLQVGDLLYAGIIIASLGAVMDIAISVATSVNEVLGHKPDADFKELFYAGMNVGRDMMGTMANTLILAFIGASVASFILMYSYQVQFNQLFNSSGIAVDILEAVCGSLAVILTVPIVSAIAGKLLLPTDRQKPSVAQSPTPTATCGQEENSTHD